MWQLWYDHKIFLSPLLVFEPCPKQVFLELFSFAKSQTTTLTTAKQINPKYFGEFVSNKNENATVYKALFSSKKFWVIDTIALSFVFDKHCLIMD